MTQQEQATLALAGRYTAAQLRVHAIKQTETDLVITVSGLGEGAIATATHFIWAADRSDWELVGRVAA